MFSYFTACKYALPHLRKTKGNIINVSSLVGHIGQPGATTYVSTKGGICAFTRVTICMYTRAGKT
jgi:NAD(P)-dependent dehydrogenase (short-subunit alcohol dehydrogenase family)